MFIGAAGGIALSHLAGLPMIAGVAMGIGAMAVTMLGLPLTSVLLTAVFLQADEIALMPLIIVAVVVAYVASVRFMPVPTPAGGCRPPSPMAPEPDDDGPVAAPVAFTLDAPPAAGAAGPVGRPDPRHHRAAARGLLRRPDRPGRRRRPGWCCSPSASSASWRCSSTRSGSILDSPMPQLRAAETLATVVPLVIVVFALFYVGLSASDPSGFSEPITKVNGLYFTVTVLSTVGFGDITALTDGPRIAVTVQMVIDLLIVGVLVKVIIGASRIAVERRRAEASARGTALARGLTLRYPSDRPRTSRRPSTGARHWCGRTSADRRSWALPRIAGSTGAVPVSGDPGG